MQITRSYVLEVIKAGIAKHDGSIASYERAAKIPPGHIKDIRKWGKGKGGTEIPRADRFQRMLEASGIIDKSSANSMIDTSLWLRSMDAILKAAKTRGRKLTESEERVYPIMLYNHVMECRAEGLASSPDEATAMLILKQKAA